MSLSVTICLTITTAYWNIEGTAVITLRAWPHCDWLGECPYDDNNDRVPLRLSLPNAHNWAGEPKLGHDIYALFLQTLGWCYRA